jgi:hypothetical protein
MELKIHDGCCAPDSRVRIQSYCGHCSRGAPFSDFSVFAPLHAFFGSFFYKIGFYDLDIAQEDLFQAVTQWEGGVWFLRGGHQSHYRGQIFLLGTVPAITSYANSRVRAVVRNHDSSTCRPAIGFPVPAMLPDMQTYLSPGRAASDSGCPCKHILLPCSTYNFTSEAAISLTTWGARWRTTPDLTPSQNPAWPMDTAVSEFLGPSCNHLAHNKLGQIQALHSVVPSLWCGD